MKNIRSPRPAWRPRKFETPQQLADEFVRYADFIEKNPIVVEQTFRGANGRTVSTELWKHRPMTVESFCAFLGVASRTWRHWRSYREDLSDIVELIEVAIFDQLFCLAAANLVKANLISRKLGVSHRSQ